MFDEISVPYVTSNVCFVSQRLAGRCPTQPILKHDIAHAPHQREGHQAGDSGTVRAHAYSLHLRATYTPSSAMAPGLM